MRGSRIVASAGLLLAACGGGDSPGGGGDAAGPEADAGVACSTATLVAPVPDAEGVLGPDADADGEPCGATFWVDVIVRTDAEDGAAAELMVNRSRRASATASDGQILFEGVPLDNRGDAANQLAVAFDDCVAALPDLAVDCEGVSCSLTTPDSSAATLGPADDVDAAPGVQVDVEVATDDDAVGEPVGLLVDGIAVAEVDASGDGSGAVAVFESVALEAGERALQASCRDGRGNVTRSGVARFTVTE